MNKMKKFRLVDTFFKCGLCFFIFSQEMPQNFKKLVESRKFIHISAILEDFLTEKEKYYPPPEKAD